MPGEKKVQATVVGSLFSLAIGKIEISRSQGARERLMSELPVASHVAANAVLDTGDVTPPEMLRAVRSRALGWSRTGFVRKHTCLDYALTMLLLAISAPHWGNTLHALFSASSAENTYNVWGMLGALAVIKFASLWYFVLPQHIAAHVVSAVKSDGRC